MRTATFNMLLALLFFVSGFCGLLYQTVWLRLSYAQFGVISPVVSVVVSVFMLGLGMGALAAGRFSTCLTKRLPPLAVYGLVELFIGCGAFAVPLLLRLGGQALLQTGQSDSLGFLIGSGFWIALALFPFAFAMGTTYPLALEVYQTLSDRDGHRFGYLYAFNTAGAVVGCATTVFCLIELLGFSGTLATGAILNFAIAITAIICAGRLQLTQAAPKALAGAPPQAEQPEAVGNVRFDLLILFCTGFSSMALEVAWIRGFGCVLWQSVYTFGYILVSYLIGHACGAALHYANARRGRQISRANLLAAATVASCSTLVLANPQWILAIPFVDGLHALKLLLAASIAAIAGVLGWLTPMLVDRVSASKPELAGKAYAANIAGCTFGPLLSGYILVPMFGAMRAMIFLGLPFVALLCAERGVMRTKVLVVALYALLAIPLLATFSWEDGGVHEGAKRAVFRDYAATTVAYYKPSGWKELWVNGALMSTPSPVTKLMADLPLAFHVGKAKNVLVICLGVGTSYKTALSWGTNVTVVELVPGVVGSFRYFHADKPQFTQNPHGRIIVDDGRRFLNRTNEKFDVIIIDPPPPAEQAASSLLYSSNFYDVIKKHLQPDGVVQLWWGFRHDNAMAAAFARSAFQSFPYVKVFDCIDDPGRVISGMHFLCSLQPLSDMSDQQFLDRMPESAKDDLKEWSVGGKPEQEMVAYIHQLLSRQKPIATALVDNPGWKIDDDRPFNEYYLLRRYLLSPASPDK